MRLCQTFNSTLYCNECDVFLGSETNRALHVLTKEHVKNLIRLGKRKPEPESIMSEGTSSDLGISKATPVMVEYKKSTIPAFGCVTDNKMFTSEAFEESDCAKFGPNWQNLAKNPLKEQVISKSEIVSYNSTILPTICKPITKSLISCEVCNVILTKLTDYERHLESLQHVWNMKLRKKGDAANFVKTSTHSQTANTVKVSMNSFQVNNNDIKQLTPPCENFGGMPFPLLYCDACELLLNTHEQFYTHMNGISHKLCVEKKGKMKVKKIQFPTSDKYYCYSCKLLINSFSQYEEHKAGKKHKIKCSQLLAMGIMIPPGEQLPEWNLPKISSDKPVRYPEFYEKFVLEKQRGELMKSSNVKQLQMKENGCESSECRKTLDTTSTEILRSFKSETVPHHIYRIQNKSVTAYSEFPFTIVGNKYYFKSS